MPPTLSAPVTVPSDTQLLIVTFVPFGAEELSYQPPTIPPACCPEAVTVP